MPPCVALSPGCGQARLHVDPAARGRLLTPNPMAQRSMPSDSMLGRLRPSDAWQAVRCLAARIMDMELYAYITEGRGYAGQLHAQATAD